MLNSLRNTLNYFANTHAHLNYDGIVLSGGGARLGGFSEALEEVTRVPVAAANPFSTVELSRDLRKREPRNPPGWPWPSDSR